MNERASQRALRILCVVNVPWDVRLGAARVWMELGAEWERAGHTVEKFCLTDAYPRSPRSAALAAARLLFFPYRAAAHVRRNAERFDIVDCLIGTLPFRKASLRFGGLLVGRSVGLFHCYEKLERAHPRRRKTAASLFYDFFNARARAASRRSLDTSDLLNVPNASEADVLREELRCSTPVLVEPYGLRPDYARALASAAVAVEEKLRVPQVCFLGMWSRRKGAQDWAEIVRRVHARVPEARFLFLGTMVDDAVVRRDLGDVGGDMVEIVAQYAPEELPRLIRRATVGAFPSYVEGFGIAILEQLAAGIPVVAYDCAGPRDILGTAFPQLLVPAGDAARLAESIATVLTATNQAYDELARASRDLAAAYDWAQIANRTMDQYRSQLARIAPHDRTT